MSTFPVRQDFEDSPDGTATAKSRWGYAEANSFGTAINELDQTRVKDGDFRLANARQPEDLSVTAGKISPGAVTSGKIDPAAVAAFRDRATHTGVQPSSTISDFTEAVQDAVALLLTQGTNVTLAYNDAGNSLTISAAGGGGGGTGLDAEGVRDAIGIAMVGLGNISVVVNDAADTITITTTATVNDTDANLKNRANHSGTQPAASISDLTETVQDIVAAFILPGTGMTKTYDDAGNTLTLNSTATGGSGGNDPRVDGFVGVIGDGRAADAAYLVTLPFASRSIPKPSFQRVAYPFDYLGDVFVRQVSNQSLSVEPGEIWTNGQYRMIVPAMIGYTDVTNPAAGTIAQNGTAGATTMPVKASGFTDANGIIAYNWYKGGVYQTSTSTSTDTYIYTGLAQNTPTPSLQVSATDASWNESVLSAGITPSTVAAPNASFAAVGSGQKLTPGSGTSVTATETQVVNAGEMILVWAAISHGNYVKNSDYDSVSITSNKAGTWTRIPFVNPDVNPGGTQPSGSIIGFYCLNPEAGTHQLSVTVADTGITVAAAYLTSATYAGVASVANPTVAVADNGLVNLVLPSAVGNMNAFAIASANSAVAGLNKTPRYQPAGGDVAGYVDYFVTGDCAGAATSVAVTSTNALYYAAAGVQLVKA